MPLTSVRYSIGPSSFRAVIPRGPMEYSVSPMQFGAAGDGIVDDVIPVQRAMNAMGAAGGVVVVDRPYKCGSQINWLNQVRIHGSPGGLLDFTGANPANFPSSKCLAAAGSLSALPTIGANVNLGEKTITFASAPGLIPHDVFVIYDTTAGSFNSARPSYRAGEYGLVVGVVGNVVTVDAPFFDEYTVGANILVFKLNATTVSIDGSLTIFGLGVTSAVSVVGVSLGRSINLSGLRDLTGSQYSLLELDRCFDADVGELNGSDFGANAGLNYGLMILSCQRIRGREINFSVTRHASTMGHAVGNASVPNREVLIEHSALVGKDISGADIHGNSESCRYSDCQIFGGFSLGGKGNSLVDCEIWADTVDGIAGQFSEVLRVDCNLINCKFHATRIVGNGLGSVPALVYWDREGVVAEDTLEPGGLMEIQNCVFDMHGFNGAILSIRQAFAQTDNSIGMDGCSFRRPADASLQSLVRVVGHSTSVAQSRWKNISISSCTLDGAGLSVSRCGAQIVNINDVISTSSARDGIQVFDPDMTLSWSTQHFSIYASNIERAQNTGVYCRGADGAISTLDIQLTPSVNNGQSGAGGTDTRASFSAINFKNARIARSAWGDDQTVPTQTRWGYFDTITKLEHDWNTNVGGALAVTYVGIAGFIRRDPSTLLGLDVGAFGLSAGMGAGAVVDSVAGTDVSGRFRVTVGAAPGANPTCTLTFKNGAWPSAPFVVTSRNGGTGTLRHSWTSTVTTSVVTLEGVPVAGETYTFAFEAQP